MGVCLTTWPVLTAERRVRAEGSPDVFFHHWPFIQLDNTVDVQEHQNATVQTSLSIYFHLRFGICQQARYDRKSPVFANCCKLSRALAIEVDLLIGRHRKGIKRKHSMRQGQGNQNSDVEKI